MRISAARDSSGSHGLSPTLIARGHALVSGGRFRSVRIRRTIALILVVAAAVVGTMSARTPPPSSAVTAAADLLPGTVLSAADLAVTSVARELAVPGTAATVEEVVGKRVTGPVRRGEPITESRLLTSRLPAALTGDPGARLVPVRPADETVTQLVRQGDLVDVIDAEATVLARDAVVAVAPDTRSGRAAGAAASPILLAMNPRAAQAVAATGLGTALALILH